MKGPLSPHLRPQHLRSGKEIPAVETTPQIPRREKVTREHWWRRWRLGKKSIWLSVLFLVSLALAALHLAYTEVPMYRAEATLLIGTQQGSLSGSEHLPGRSSSGLGANDDKTQYELLKSHSLVSRILREQKLSSSSLPANSNQSPQPQPRGMGNAIDAPPDIKLRAIEEYLTNLEVLPIAETRLVKVAYRATNPQLAARLANLHVEAYLQQNQEQRQSQQGRIASVTLVDKAIPPVQPTRSRTHFLLFGGGVAGLLLGGGLLVWSRRSDATVRTPADVSRYLKLASLGAVPDFSSEVLRREGSMPVPPQFETFPGVFSKELLLGYPPLSLIPEAYRNLRAELLLSRSAGPPRSLLVTSAMSGEGKTLTALNTAIALAQMGARVLLIDADLRHPHCHAVLKMAKGLGLTEFLTGQCDLAEVIQTTRVDRLFFVSGGACPPNPAELLGAKKMHAAISFLSNLYDYIVIDSPPLGLVSDALLLSSRVDGVMVVVNGQTTHYKVVQEAVARLDRARAKVLGVVLNKVDAHSREYAEYGRRYRAYYRQPSVQEEPVTVVDTKKRSKKGTPGRTSAGKTNRKSTAKVAKSTEAPLLGVAASHVPTDPTTVTTAVTEEPREPVWSAQHATDPQGAEPKHGVENSAPLEVEGPPPQDVTLTVPVPDDGGESQPSEGDEDTMLALGIADDTNDNFPYVDDDADGSRADEAHREISAATNLDRTQST